ncbi:hypothetical protein PS874_06467 [Pseudomonas fluorescens]|nr:hypothetical protein PS874_06467 [Pseudomonas fluorescens]
MNGGGQQSQGELIRGGTFLFVGEAGFHECVYLDHH